MPGKDPGTLSSLENEKNLVMSRSESHISVFLENMKLYEVLAMLSKHEERPKGNILSFPSL